MLHEVDQNELLPRQKATAGKYIQASMLFVPNTTLNVRVLIAYSPPLMGSCTSTIRNLN